MLDKVAATIEPRSIQEMPVIAEIPAADNLIVNDLVKPVTRRSILRGPDVYIVEDHRLPLVSFGIFYPGGRLYELERAAERIAVRSINSVTPAFFCDSYRRPPG